MDDYAVLPIIEYLFFMPDLEEFEIQIYGNGLSQEVLKGFLDAFRDLKLKKLNFSIFEFKNPDIDENFEEIIRAFNELAIVDKKLN